MNSPERRSQTYPSRFFQWSERQINIGWLNKCWNRSYRDPACQKTVQVISRPLKGVEGGAIVEYRTKEAQSRNPLQAWLAAMLLYI
jgi:hypothetical protein